jgi:hypothetical protein
MSDERDEWRRDPSPFWIGIYLNEAGILILQDTSHLHRPARIRKPQKPATHSGIEIKFQDSRRQLYNVDTRPLQARPIFAFICCFCWYLLVYPNRVRVGFSGEEARRHWRWWGELDGAHKNKHVHI